MVVLTSLFLSLSISEISGPKFPKKFLVVRTSLSLAVTLREEGQVKLRGETPNGLSASKTLKESHLLVYTTLV
jgi:hypothetical protein